MERTLNVNLRFITGEIDVWTIRSDFKDQLLWNIEGEEDQICTPQLRPTDKQLSNGRD